MKARTLMVQGTSSSAGKSLLVTALCRIFARQGLRVAPFKAQNMALNSAITAEGHEIGRAQAVQAEAAGLEPEAAMNPVLLKPAGEKCSQVIVMGRAVGHMDAREYYVRRPEFIPAVRAAFEDLAGRCDLIILEGAGSPAEINLRENDIANMGAAAIADAPVLLVGDIERGGVFASLYGTLKLLEPDEQSRIRAFVINKFRGDPHILEPGLRQLEYISSRPVIGVLPWWELRIDEEDSLAECLRRGRTANKDGPAPDLDIAVPRLPGLSNFTDFAAFATQPDVALRYVDSAAQLAGADMIILPGSKNPLADLSFLHASSMAGAIVTLHGRGTAVAGLGGGLQMLGRTARALATDQGGPEEMPGLGLLDMESEADANGRHARTGLNLAPDLPGLLREGGGMRLEGYEIGQTRCFPGPEARFMGLEADKNPAALVNAGGTVFGTCLHGFFDNLAFTRALLNGLRQARGLAPLPWSGDDYASLRQKEYDRLADLTEAGLDMEALCAIIGWQSGAISL
ncbi:cobyric acid synthase [Desulfovibrio sp. OttesenSCG-928-G11]|nr:cobyric acid synthase [Desulfovibrio sp. OttesenSCG-928-G11]